VSAPKTAFVAPMGGSVGELSAWLEDAGFAVRVFDGGQDLMDAAQVFQPSVIVLDVDLPSSSAGLETTRALKQDPLTQPIPVILLAGGGEDAGAACFDAGADDFILKPVRRRELGTRARAAARAFADFQRRHQQHAELADMYFRLAETEEKARLSEARVHAIIEAAQDAVFTLDADGHPDLMNGAAEAMFGLPRTEAAATRFVELFAGGAARAALCDALARVASGETRAERQEACARSRAGDEFPVDCSITCAERPEGPIVCVVVRDLRAARRIEALLRQTQQLEAVGRIASGIAHEINTPIQCIGDTLHFMEQTFAELRPLLDVYREVVAGAAAAGAAAEFAARARDAEQAADIEYVLEAAPDALAAAMDMSRRITNIVKATKAFARPEQRGATHVPLGALVRNVLDLSRASCADVADFDLHIEDVTALVHAGELSDAIRHIVSNAADAVRATGRRGRIWVRVERADDAARVTVTDDGCGIPPDLAPRIFDPFFTTKEVGRGVGLGLFVASSAAHRHEGSLTFEARPGGGSTFILRIPFDYRAERSKPQSGQPVRDDEAT
jgi:two-component system, NtrC family, sensor kinase